MKIHAPPRHSLEILEARIAPSAVFTYGDVDADLAAIVMPFLVAEAGASGMELQKIDFSAGPVLPSGKSIFHGADLTITAKRTSVGGDGLANVGYIDASAAGGGTALDLGKVTIKGDLARIDAGDATTATAAVKSLSVQSMGLFGLSTQGAGASLLSILNGALGALAVKSDIAGATLKVSSTADLEHGKIGAVNVSGSLIGVSADGAITSFGDIGPVKIGRDIVGSGAGSDGSGFIATEGKIASVTIGGSVFGGGFTQSGAISGLQIGAVKIAGNLEGGAGPQSGRINTNTLASVTIRGSDHYGFAAQQIGSFKIGASAFTLTAGAGTDLLGLAVGSTGDLRVREVL